MVCRHPPGYHDRDGEIYASANASAEEKISKNNKEWKEKYDKLSASIPPSPDSKNYFIERAERIGKHLVVEVSYPNCTKCAYEGRKVMVFLNTSEADALMWREIDPHFRAPEKLNDNLTRVKKRQAPSPSARFPASPEGWEDAKNFAITKSTKIDSDNRQQER